MQTTPNRPRDSITRKNRLVWTVIVGAAVLSAIPIVVGALEAPPDSPLRYRLFGTLGVHIGVLLVPAVFLVFSIPGRIRLRRARAETPGALYIVHSDLAEGGYEAIQVLGATPFRNYAVVNQTLCFAPEIAVSAGACSSSLQKASPLSGLFAFFPPPSHRKYAGILAEIRSALNIPTPD